MTSLSISISVISTACDIPPREGDSTQRRSSQSQVHFTTFINRKKYCIVRYRDFDTVRP